MRNNLNNSWINKNFRNSFMSKSKGKNNLTFYIVKINNKRPKDKEMILYVNVKVYFEINSNLIFLPLLFRNFLRLNVL